MIEISKKIFSTFVSCVILFFPNKLFKKINTLNQINLENYNQKSMESHDKTILLFEIYSNLSGGDGEIIHPKI